MIEYQQANNRQAIVFARNLFPALGADLDRALERTLAASGDGTGNVETFEERLEVEVHRFQHRHAELAWHDVVSARARTDVLNAFGRARAVLQGSSVQLPAPESFARTVNLAAITEPFPPGFAVVPAPYGLGLATWHKLFDLAAARQPRLLSSAEPLIVASEASREFAQLDEEPPTEGTVAPNDSGTVLDAAGLRWTLRLVPEGAAPALLGLNFEHGPHATLPEMLMLQLMRITAGDDPVDQASFTWLAGALAGGKLAARHVYDAADLAVRVSCREIGNQGPHLGARIPRGLVA